jgi:hypothetical protein
MQGSSNGNTCGSYVGHSDQRGRTKASGELKFITNGKGTSSARAVMLKKLQENTGANYEWEGHEFHSCRYAVENETAL